MNHDSQETSLRIGTYTTTHVLCIEPLLWENRGVLVSFHHLFAICIQARVTNTMANHCKHLRTSDPVRRLANLQEMPECCPSCLRFQTRTNLTGSPALNGPFLAPLLAGQLAHGPNQLLELLLTQKPTVKLLEIREYLNSRPFQHPLATLVHIDVDWMPENGRSGPSLSPSALLAPVGHVGMHLSCQLP